MSTWRVEMAALARLSVPLALGSAGNQLMGLVDTAMVGRLGAAALGGVGIANGLYFAITILGMGCVFGMDPLVSQAQGAGEAARARRLLWQGLRVALLVGVPLTALVALAPAILAPAGVEPATAATARLYLMARAPNVLPFLVASAQRSYLQAHGNTRPIVVSMIVANVCNVVGNTLLIWGDGALVWVGLPGIGLPALGVVGSAIASVLATLVQCLVLAAAVRRMEAPADLHRRAADWDVVRRILRVGTPVGLQYLAEVGVFALAGVLAGRFGAVAAAGHQLALTLASFTFTVTVGLSHATSVRVGLAVGRSRTEDARRAGLSGLLLGAAFMSAAAVLFLVAPRGLARFLTDDAAVLSASVPLLAVAAVFQVFDGLQAVGAGALRGAGDTRAAMWANVVGHYAVGLPLAVGLGFGLGWGVVGLWWGLAAGLTVVAVALAGRFLQVSSRPILRV